MRCRASDAGPVYPILVNRRLQNILSVSSAPVWARYTGAVLVQFALVVLLDALKPKFPLSDFPAPYAAVLLLTVLLFGDGPAFVAWALGLCNYVSFFVPAFQRRVLPTSPHAWAPIVAYLIITATVGVATSLLRRKNADLAELATELEERAALLDLSFDAIIVQEEETGRVVGWNRSAEETYGYTHAEAAGKNASALLRTRYPMPRRQILEYLSRHTRWEGDLTQYTKDGRRLTIASCWTLHKPAGKKPLLLEANRDVTQLRLLEEERSEFAALQQRIAVTLQRSLLMSPPFDIFPGLTAKACYQSAQEDVLIGGDFFDMYAVAENRVALVVGDATGKGLDSAIYTAEVKFILRAFLREHHTPAVALTRLNALLAQKEWPDPLRGTVPYIAVIVAVVDTLTGRIVVAAAGINRPLLVPASGADIVALEAGGPPLGAIEGYQFQDEEGQLDAGDLIALYSDGLVEARTTGRPYEFFGDDRLAALIRREAAPDTPLSDIAYRVVEHVRQFAGGSIGDDVCLLLAKRTAP